MIDFNLRNIAFQLDGVWYTVTFRTAPLGRVKDVKVLCSDHESGFLYPSRAKVIPQNITAADAVKMFGGEMVSDIKFRLQQFLQRGLSPK